MSHWITVAERLREVKNAREEFLFRDFVDRCIIGPMLLDRVTDAIGPHDPEKSDAGHLPMIPPARLADDE